MSERVLIRNTAHARSMIDDLTAERDHARAIACRLEEELAQHRCHVCGGTREHVLGCPEMDRPR